MRIRERQYGTTDGAPYREKFKREELREWEEVMEKENVSDENEKNVGTRRTEEKRCETR